MSSMLHRQGKTNVRMVIRIVWMRMVMVRNRIDKRVSMVDVSSRTEDATCNGICNNSVMPVGRREAE